MLVHLVQVVKLLSKTFILLYTFICANKCLSLINQMCQIE